MDGILMELKPKLRPLDFQPVFYQEQQMWFLRDPLHLTDLQLIFPTPMVQLLAFLDGRHTPQEIHNAFCRHIGVEIDYEIVNEALSRLDEACLLDNERSKQAQERLLAEYRAQPHRSPALANHGYPAEPDKLAAYLDGYGDGSDVDTGRTWHGRGIVSPHIDYERGGNVYAGSLEPGGDGRMRGRPGADSWYRSQWRTRNHYAYATTLRNAEWGNCVQI